MNRKIFYLVGFMASGKSTIGPILANTLGWNFYDLDREIEKREKREITKIFNENGEEYFRKKETEILKEISSGDNLIISLGGGTLVTPENREFVAEKGKLIFLSSSAEVAYRRLKHKRDRPVLLSDDENESITITLERIETLMKNRNKYYNNADYIFDTDNVSIGSTVDKIAKIIHNSSKNSKK